MNGRFFGALLVVTAILPCGSTVAGQGKTGRPTAPRPSKAALNSALLSAASAGDLARTMALVARGADVNTKDRNGGTPLFRALSGGELAKHGLGPSEEGVEVATFLLRHGADVEARDAQGRTALHIAAGRAREGFLEAVLARKPKTDQTDKDGRTPLVVACSCRNLPAVEALLKQGANVNARDRLGFPALAYALVKPLDPVGGLLDLFSEPGTRIVELLLSHGADVAAKLPGNGTLLMIAAAFGRDADVATLIARGVPVDAADDRGQTALATACLRSRPGIAKALLEAGADPNRADARGMTPLMLAADAASYASVERLIKAGARLDAKANDGTTALLAAQKKSHTAIVNQLKEAGAKP